MCLFIIHLEYLWQIVVPLSSTLLCYFPASIKDATLYLCWDKEGVEEQNDTILDSIFRAVDADANRHQGHEDLESSASTDKHKRKKDRRKSKKKSKKSRKSKKRRHSSTSSSKSDTYSESESSTSSSDEKD